MYKFSETVTQLAGREYSPIMSLSEKAKIFAWLDKSGESYKSQRTFLKDRRHNEEFININTI